MIKGHTTTANTVDSVLNILSVLPNRFFLTGSRFFGGYTKDSDWDFFVEDNLELRNSLNILGFIALPKQEMIDKGYNASQFVEVLEKQTQDGVIQIQMIKNIYAKETCQNLIKEYFLERFNAMDKEGRKALWSLLLLAHS